MTAPKVTLEDIEDQIIAELFFTGDEVEKHVRQTQIVRLRSDIYDPLKCLTVCILLLRNGFTAVGTSACVSSENFDADLGRSLARKDAIGKVWPLMGYALAERLYQESEND